MASDGRLTHDDLLFVLFNAAYTMSKTDSFTTQARIGRWAEQGFVWTTEYTVRHEEFFSTPGNHEPDGHLKYQPGSVLVTVEATTNPRKPNLKPQLEFYCSNAYQDTVVDTDHHEVWFFVSALALDGFRAGLADALRSSVLERNPPIIVWSVDYDRNRHLYVIKKVEGQHSARITGSGNPPLSKIEVPLPRSYPLLSAKLSAPAVVFAIGIEFLRVILDPGPPKSMEEVWQDFPANAVRQSYFSDCVGYLSVLVPDLVELVSEGGGRLVKIKNNPGRIKQIKKALEGIRKMKSRDQIEQSVRKAREKPPPAEAVKKEIPEQKPRTLDDFLD